MKRQEKMKQEGQNNGGARLTRLSRFLYIVGVQSVRVLKKLGRWLKKKLRPLWMFIGLWLNRLTGRWIAGLKADSRALGEGLKIARARLQKARSFGLLQMMEEFFSVVSKSMVRHRKVFWAIINVAAPAAAVIALFFTVQYWSGLEFGLLLSYGDEQVGVIQDESTFDAATDMVNARMVHAAPQDAEAAVSLTPVFSLVAADKSAYTSAAAVCDAIIEQSDGIIAEGTGLSVDGKIVGVVKSSADLNHILNEILEEAKQGDSKADAQFAQHIETTTGLFPTSAFISSNELSAMLQGTGLSPRAYKVQENDSIDNIAESFALSQTELRTINPSLTEEELQPGNILMVNIPKKVLEVEVTKLETYEEEIPYSTVTENDDSQYTDYTAVRVQGVNGVKEQTDRVTYIDGEEVNREKVSEVVVSEPTDKVVVTGTKKRPTGYEPGIGSGLLIWPTPSLRIITTYYEYRWGSFHTGLDISGGAAAGKPIVAADGGVVTTAGYHSSYGNYIIINHGNGMTTLYAHSSRLLVSVGDKVAKGQTIALVGSTGNSTGAHLHFEVRVNGALQNPLQYVG